MSGIIKKKKQKKNFEMKNHPWMITSRIVSYKKKKLGSEKSSINFDSRNLRLGRLRYRCLCFKCIKTKNFQQSIKRIDIVSFFLYSFKITYDDLIILLSIKRVEVKVTHLPLSIPFKRSYYASRFAVNFSSPWSIIRSFLITRLEPVLHRFHSSASTFYRVPCPLGTRTRRITHC